MEDHPSIMDNAANDSKIINESFSVIRLEDLINGSQESYTMGPARISTWVMVALLLIGATYPSYIIYKKLYRCLIKCKESGNSAAVPVRNDSVEANLPTERIEFRRENTMEESKWTPGGRSGPEGLQNPRGDRGSQDQIQEGESKGLHHQQPESVQGGTTQVVRERNCQAG